MAEGKFATSISCMDGRIQLALNNWIRENYDVDYVDTITSPGVDRKIAKSDHIEKIIDMTRISTEKHGSRLIIISGHYDCAGNPVSNEEHLSHIKLSVDKIKRWESDYNLCGTDDKNKPDVDNQSIKVVGVWVGDTWSVQRIPNNEQSG